MAKYRVRLESPDLMRPNGEPHFRDVSLSADSADEARHMCEIKEYKIAAHTYSGTALAELEEAEADALERGHRPSANVRMRLATHRQERPYTVVSVEEVI